MAFVEGHAVKDRTSADARVPVGNGIVVVVLKEYRAATLDEDASQVVIARRDVVRTRATLLPSLMMSYERHGHRYGNPTENGGPCLSPSSAMAPAHQQTEHRRVR